MLEGAGRAGGGGRPLKVESRLAEMWDMETISGQVSMLQPLQRVGRHGIVWHKAAFLLDKHPVELTLSEAPELRDGDELVVAGQTQRGADRFLVTVGSMLIVIGIFTIPILVGLLAIPLGIHIINKGRKVLPGLFNGYAFHNRTRHLYGAGHTTLEYILGLSLLFVGVGTVPILVGLVIIPVGVHSLLRARRTSQARAAISPIAPGAVARAAAAR